MAFLQIFVGLAICSITANAHGDQCAEDPAKCASSGQGLIQKHQRVQQASKKSNRTKRQRAGCPNLPYVTCEHDEMHCWGGESPDGCYKPDTCIKQQSDVTGNDGSTCGGHCPSTCGTHDVSCPGGVDRNGCPLPDWCMGPFHHHGFDGSMCPSVCPAPCGVGEMECSAGEDANGCSLPEFCISRSAGKDKWGGECWASCPHPCPPGEMHMAGGTYDNGCPAPGYCVPATTSTTTTGVPATTSTTTTGTTTAFSCPPAVTCGQGEFQCSVGGVDANGCLNPDDCVPEQTQGKHGSTCSGSCPSTCGEHDTLCPGVVDWNGCPMQDWCMGPSHHHGFDGSMCPSVCPAPCGAGEMECWAGEDANGCSLPDTCVNQSTGKTDHWGHPCYAHCPMICPADAVSCPGEPDPWNGCDMPGYCAWSHGTGNDGTACPALCHNTCGPGDQWCFGGYDDNGCEMVNTCAPQGTACP